MKQPPPKTSAPFLRRITMLPEKADPTRHPFNIEAFRDGLDLEVRSNVTFFVGENGSGKSTLLEALATCCGFNVQGGGRDHQSQAAADSDDLASALRLSWQPKATASASSTSPRPRFRPSDSWPF
jgi:predicted ATPase